MNKNNSEPHDTMKKTYTITNNRTELASVPSGKRQLVIGNMDEFQAIAIESKPLKRSNTVQPRPSTRQTSELKRRGSIKTTSSSEAGPCKDDALPKKQSTKLDYSALIIPATGPAPPKTKNAPTTEEEILARRRALGILTTPDKLGRLARGRDAVTGEKIKVTAPADVVLATIPSESSPSTSTTSDLSSSTSKESSEDSNSTASSTTVVPPTPTPTPTPESTTKEPELTPLVTVHRSDLDEIVHRNRPLTIYNDWRSNPLLANTNVSRLIAENTELRNRERRYQERQRAVEDFTIDLVLGESVGPGDKSRVQIEQEKYVQEMRKRDEEELKSDLAPPRTAKEMERRNGPMMRRRRGERLDGIQE